MTRNITKPGPLAVYLDYVVGEGDPDEYMPIDTLVRSEWKIIITALKESVDLREQIDVMSKLNREIDATLATIDEHSVDLPWLPIATAPHTGEPVLCWRQRWGAAYLLVWKTNHRIVAGHQGPHFDADAALAESYFGDPNEMDDFDYAQADGMPTHWLPFALPQEEPHVEADRAGAPAAQDREGGAPVLDVEAIRRRNDEALRRAGWQQRDEEAGGEPPQVPSAEQQAAEGEPK